MAKNSMPVMPKAGGGALAKLMWSLVVIALLVLVVKYPTDAAAIARGGFELIGGTVEGLVSFLRQVGQ